MPNDVVVPALSTTHVAPLFLLSSAALGDCRRRQQGTKDTVAGVPAAEESARWKQVNVLR